MVSPKVVIVGAGSLFFGRRAIWQMVHSPVLRGGTLGLVDTDPARLEKMKRLAEKVIAHNRSDLRLEASTDRRKVLGDADFVVLAFADRNAHFRGLDCEIAAKYGIRMCSGDTIGPGGIFRAMREQPVIEQVAEDIRQCCPQAWVINYINPTAVHGMALRRFFPDLKTLALCDAQWGLRKRYAQWTGVPNDEKLRVRTAGPNHFTWLLEAAYDGRDLIPQIVEKMRLQAEEDINQQAQGGTGQAKGYLNNAIGVQLYDTLGCLPTVIGHTKEYVRFYQKVGVAGRDPYAPLKLFEVPAREKWTREVWQRVDAYLDGSVPIAEFDTEFGSDPATDLIEGMWSNRGAEFFVNTANRGAVPNLPDDAFIETWCQVDMQGPRPLSCPELPRGIRGLCENVLDTHELTAEAIHHGSRELLLRAMLVDPLTCSIGDTEAMMEELLDAERDALPEHWFEPVVA